MSRSSVAKWPDIGATTSTCGCPDRAVLAEAQQRGERRARARLPRRRRPRVARDLHACRCAKAAARCVTSASANTSHAAASWRSAASARRTPARRLERAAASVLASVRSGHSSRTGPGTRGTSCGRRGDVARRALQLACQAHACRRTWHALASMARRIAHVRCHARSAAPKPKPRPVRRTAAGDGRHGQGDADASAARTTRRGRCAAGCWRASPGSTSTEVMVSPDDADARKELLLLSPSILRALPDARRRQGLGHAGDRRVPRTRSSPKAGLLPDGPRRRARTAARSAARCTPASPTCARRCR